MKRAKLNPKSQKPKVKDRRLMAILNKFWPILVVFILVAIFSSPYLAKGRIPLPADHLVTAFPPWQYYYGLPVKNNAMPDVVTQMYPFKHLTLEMFRSGRIPLWNPNNFSGSPYLANYQSAIFHPMNFLFAFLPEVDGWSLLILFQPLLAGWFTYLFGRQLNLSRPAALMSAIAFMFCGFMTVWMAYGTLAYALLWLPLILSGIEKSLQKLSGGSLLMIGLPLGASFFSGHFQISLYVTLFCLAYLTWRGISLKKKRAFLIGLVFLVLGVLLAAVQLLPTFELHQLSVRSSFLEINEIIPWRYLVTLISPDFYGNPVTRNDWFGHYAEWSGFIGVIPLGLAFMALLRIKKDRLVIFFLTAAVIALVLRHPTFLLDLILSLKIPVLSSSAAARINSLMSFSLAVLAGFGLEELKVRLQTKNIKTTFPFLGFFIGLVVVIWVVLLFKSPFPADKTVIAQRNMILPTGMVLALIGLVFGQFLLQRLFKSKKKLEKYCLYAVLLLLLSLSGFDMLRFSTKWLPFDSVEHVYPELPVLTFLRQETTYDRVFGYFGMEMQNYFQIQGFNGYDPLYIRRYGELLKAAGDGKIKTPSTRGVSLGRQEKYTMRLVNLLNGRYILHAIDDGRYPWAFNFWDYPGQFEQIYKDDKYEVYFNKKALDRATLVYDYQVISQPQAIVDKVLDPETEASNTVILEEEIPGFELKGRPDGQQLVKISRYSGNRIDLKVETSQPGILFVSENYYPGWRAIVDGVDQKIYRADYAFRAVPVPAGNHLVSFVYSPQSFKIGLVLSGLSLGLMIVFGISLNRARVKNK